MLAIKVTIGEAIDRLIILGLKQKAQPNNEILINEWASLRDAIDAFHRNNYKGAGETASIMVVEQELEEVNQKLWDYEDRIRRIIVGQPSAHKMPLVGLEAECIIKANDRRSQLKQQLNRYYREPQSEVKIYKD